MKFLFLLCLTSLCFTSCENYQKTVASRSDTVAGYAKDDNYGGSLTHTVTYR